MTGRVFVSHASEDAQKASLVVNGLERAGLRAWVAPRDIPPGTRYAEAILDGIDSCDLFLLLFSAGASGSPHVMNEVEHAASLDKAILLARIDTADPSLDRRLIFFVRSHQWLDASTGSLDHHIDQIVAGCLPFVSAAPGASAPAVTPPSARRSIGVELERAALRGIVLDLDCPDVYASRTLEIPIAEDTQNPRHLIAETRALISRLINEEFTPDTPPVGVGIALPGQVDVRTGTLKFAPSLNGATNVPVRSSLSSAFPRIPIRVDNDIRCATRAELHLGIGNQFDDFACLWVGSGVGSGLVLDRNVYLGANFCAGEIGHVKIAPSGAPCSCGQLGCLETFIKSESLIARARASAIDAAARERPTALTANITMPDLVAAVDGGDEAALEVVREIGQSLGLGIANYVNIINPAAVVLGGPVIDDFYFHIVDEVTTALRRNSLAEVSNTPILQSHLADDWVSAGAALLFHDDSRWRFQ